MNDNDKAQSRAELIERLTNEAITEIAGKKYMTNGEGHLVPLELIDEATLLEDQTVRVVNYYGVDMSSQIGRYMGHTFEDLATTQSILEEKYQAKPRGGTKGNATYSTFDGLMRVQIRMSDKMSFGPLLNVAKNLIDECLTSWTEDSSALIRELVTMAFQVDEKGKLDRNGILKLRTYTIPADTPNIDKWKSAMEAITKSIRVDGTKAYPVLTVKDEPGGDWRSIPISIARIAKPKVRENEE